MNLKRKVYIDFFGYQRPFLGFLEEYFRIFLHQNMSKPLSYILDVSLRADSNHLVVRHSQ